MAYLPESPYAHGTKARTGILLVNLGTPDEPTAGAVRRYLAEFLWDPRVIQSHEDWLNLRPLDPRRGLQGEVLEANALIGRGDPLQAARNYEVVRRMGKAGVFMTFMQRVDTPGFRFMSMAWPTQGQAVTSRMSLDELSERLEKACFPVVVDTGDDGIDLIRPEDSNMFGGIHGDGAS